MVKQKSHKVAAAEAQAAKDKQFKAFHQELGLLLDKDGEEPAPSTPQKAATWRPVVQSPQQRDGGAPANMLPRWIWTHPSWFQYPRSPPHLLSLSPTHPGWWFRMRGAPSCLYLLPCLAFHTLNTFPTGQAVIKLGIWRQAPHLPVQCWTWILWQWRGQAGLQRIL
jgi:hypothetical protein